MIKTSLTVALAVGALSTVGGLATASANTAGCEAGTSAGKVKCPSPPGEVKKACWDQVDREERANLPSWYVEYEYDLEEGSGRVSISPQEGGYVEAGCTDKDDDPTLLSSIIRW